MSVSRVSSYAQAESGAPAPSLAAVAYAYQLARGVERVGRGRDDRERLKPARQNLHGVVDARDEQQYPLEDVRRLRAALGREDGQRRRHQTRGL